MGFSKYTLKKIDHLGEPYDYSSIMHYTATAFSKDGVKKTIIPRDSSAKLIHSAEKYRPSDVDLAKINKLYLCPDRPTPTPVTTTTARPATTTAPDDPNCQDKNELCRGWSVHGHCKDNEAYMKVACRKSCGHCDTEKPDECEDHHAYCEDWAGNGQCEKTVDYMRFVCPKSCKYCNPQCEEFRDNLMKASRLQRLSVDFRAEPPKAPQVVIKRNKNWPQ